MPSARRAIPTGPARPAASSPARSSRNAGAAAITVTHKEKSVHPLKLAPALVLALATGACAPTMPERMGGSYDGNPDRTTTPAMAPERKVNEQDCSQAIDFFSGTLRCK